MFIMRKSEWPPTPGTLWQLEQVPENVGPPGRSIVNVFALKIRCPSAMSRRAPLRTFAQAS